ncbi:MAG: UV DNA damage repair endonuclease UvsE [Clostridia bacterium]|nr:UV DNA damage repair endonuclease UvsE [Clostridia bacterium]
MSIGYACITIGENDIKFRSIRVSNASYQNMIEVIAHNLLTLDRQIDYNIRNHIGLFRISSDLIPLATHQVNTVPWEEVFKKEFERIGEKIKKSRMRVSMHPGQYTVLNSQSNEVVEKARDDLSYHQKVLSLLGTDSSHKIVLHVGGVYQDKKASLERFINHYRLLDDSIKERLVIENDEKSYTAEDVLELCEEIDIPAVFDNLHHELNPSTSFQVNEIIELFNHTWKEKDGRQKIHYSQQSKSQKNGSHSTTIEIEPFFDFYNLMINKDVDIMLEVKDKNLSALKISNVLYYKKDIRQLTIEWARYKYLVMSNDLKDYQLIRDKLNDGNIDLHEFYQIVENNMNKPFSSANQKNAAYHIFGYFKKYSDSKEISIFNHLLENLGDSRQLNKLKSFLYRLSRKYSVDYLLHSYYFIIN